MLTLQKNIANDTGYCWSCGYEIEKEKAAVAGVNGWLLLFCISLLIVNPLFAISGGISDYKDLLQYVSVIPGVVPFLISTTIIRTAMAMFSIYAGYSLLKISHNTIRISKMCLLSLLISSILINFSPSIFLPLPSEDISEMNMAALKYSLRSFVYFIIWYLYLVKSKRVKNTYGKLAKISNGSDFNGSSEWFFLC